MKERNFYLCFDGSFEDALNFVQSMRGMQNDHGLDYPKILHDFIFAIEVRLQNAGYLNENFEERNHDDH